MPTSGMTNKINLLWQWRCDVLRWRCRFLVPLIIARTDILKGTKIKFHRFPLKNEELCKKWVIATKRKKDWTPTVPSCICTEKFTADDCPFSDSKRLNEDWVLHFWFPLTFNSGWVVYYTIYIMSWRSWKFAK